MSEYICSGYITVCVKWERYYYVWNKLVSMTETIVLGLDGANWGVIEDWLNDGHLPNIQSLREEGTHAISKSELPPVTCPNWKCYATGKDPGGFGVFWWERINFEEQSILFPDETSFKSPEIWDYLADEGCSWASLNMPTTYPPRDIPNGDIIAGGPLCADDGYTVDPALEDTLEQQFDYRVFPETTFHDKDASQTQIDTTLEVLESRFDVAEWYLDNHDPDFFHMTVFLLNYIQHFFWDGEPLREAWEIIDERVGALDDRCHNLVLISDHGSNEIETVFYINNWLQQEGYLSTQSDVSDAFGNAGLTQERLVGIVSFLGLRDLAKKAPDFLKSLFPQEDGAKRDAKARIVRWEESLALASGQGPLYVSHDVDNREAKIDQLITELENLETPDGNPVASRVLRGEQAYSGEFLDIAPDIVIEQAPGVHITDGIGKSEIFTNPTRWRAENDRDGIFLAKGPEITNSELDTVSILDIAPTLLHLNELSVPTDMQGKVLDIFESDSAKSSDTVTSRTPLHISDGAVGDADAVEQRLEDLGYLEQ